jgi:hypothetical protein
MGHVWGEKKCLQGFMGKPEGKRPRVRTRFRLEDNIIMNLKEIG